VAAPDLCAVAKAGSAKLEGCKDAEPAWAGVGKEGDGGRRRCRLVGGGIEGAEGWRWGGRGRGGTGGGGRPEEVTKLLPPLRD